MRGKVDRFHETLKRWLINQPPATTLIELQAQFYAFVDEYNHHCPHHHATRPPPTPPGPKQHLANASTPKGTRGGDAIVSELAGTGQGVMCLNRHNVFVKRVSFHWSCCRSTPKQDSTVTDCRDTGCGKDGS
jgi:hypothetical protein